VIRSPAAATGRRLALLLLAGLALVAPVPPEVVERWYSQGLYPRLQPVVTTLSNLVPFAWLDVLIGVALVAAGVCIGRAWRDTSRPPLRRATGVAMGGLEAAAVLYLVFLLAWGFNYRRVPPDERFGVDEGRLSVEHLRALVAQAVGAVNATHDPDARDERLALPVLTRTLRPSFHAAQARLGTGWDTVTGRPKASLVARGFRLSSVDGMLNPFGLEVLLNPEVLPFERPFVLAHEWAHLAGHADESEASFLAWLTCLEGDEAAQYSGWLAVLLHAVRGLPPGERRPAIEALEAGPRADIQALQLRFERSHPVVRAVSWQVYEQYLRANRVEAGLASYDEVVRLVLGSRVAVPFLDQTATPAQRDGVDAATPELP
jgi:hypothetical protein